MGQRIITFLRDFSKILRANPFTTSVSFILFMWITIPWVVTAYERNAQGANITNYTEGLWWGIVTILTVGYGDRYPVTPEGRMWASLMMLGGVAGIGIVTAKISSVFLEKALRDRRGQVETDQLKNHFIICGWKPEMHSLLKHILKSNPHMTAANIVLINNVSDSEIEALHDFPELKKLKVIKGDFFTIDVIKRAAPERAQKILILADATPGPKGAIPTRTEADARTVMTAMTLSNIAKGTSIAAEILDNSMDQYLKLAGVHEIIYSRDYSRLLLALASTGTGVTTVFHDLIDPHSEYSLGTMEIPIEAHNQTYLKLKEIFATKKTDLTLLGILENSGNGHQAKEMALRKAQQTPNIQQLVENLQSVKSLRFNRPVFTPKDDYVVLEGSMAIIIKGRGAHGGA